MKKIYSSLFENSSDIGNNMGWLFFETPGINYDKNIQVCKQSVLTLSSPAWWSQRMSIYCLAKFGCGNTCRTADITRWLLLTIHEYRNNASMSIHCCHLSWIILWKGRQKDYGDFNVYVSIKPQRKKYTHLFYWRMNFYRTLKVILFN